MDYAIVMYFDEESDFSITRIMRNICRIGVNSYMLDLCIRPHITLAVFEETNPGILSSWLEAFANNQENIRIKFGSIGVFPVNPGVLFLAPIVEEELIGLHNSFNKNIGQLASVFESNYLPGNWVPHCTLATKLSKKELLCAFGTVISDFEPFTATVVQVALVRCNPYKEIVTFGIGKQLKNMQEE